MTVSVEYTLENEDMELHNVLIAIPLESDSAPDVRRVFARDVSIKPVLTLFECSR